MSVGLITSAYPTQPTNLNGISFASAITRLMPNGTAPLFGLTSLLKDETASNIEHGYFSKTMIFPSATLSALVADGVATSFTVVAHTDINIGDMLMVASTQETVLVTGFADATHITVVRGLVLLLLLRLQPRLFSTLSVTRLKKALRVRRQLTFWLSAMLTIRKSSVTRGLLPRPLLQFRRLLVLVTSPRASKIVPRCMLWRLRRRCSSVRSSWAPAMAAHCTPKKVLLRA